MSQKHRMSQEAEDAVFKFLTSGVAVEGQFPSIVQAHVIARHRDLRGIAIKLRDGGQKSIKTTGKELEAALSSIKFPSGGKVFNFTGCREGAALVANVGF